MNILLFIRSCLNHSNNFFSGTKAVACWMAAVYLLWLIVACLCQGKNHVWKWFDDRSGRWTNYGSSNNKSIDDAYREGKSSVRLVFRPVY